MNILFALSQIEVTGAETYAVTLARALRQAGHDVVFVSDTLRDSDGFKFLPLPLHGRNNSVVGRIRNVVSLKEIMDREAIVLIHSHSRAANLVGHFAKMGRRVPMVVTVHGRWRNHFAARVLPCMGEKTVAICPYLQRYLVQDIGMDARSVVMVPNGIDTNLFTPIQASVSGPTLLYAGRFSGQKGNVARYLLRSVFPEVVRRLKSVSILLAALSPGPEDRRLIDDFNSNFGHEVVKMTDYGSGSARAYHRATAVIGSGRVALEAMACGKPVLAIGESSAPGLLSPHSFEKAFDSNFGDCGAWNLFTQENGLVQDIIQILTEEKLKDELGAWGRSLVCEKFDSTKIAAEISKIYQDVAMS